MSGYKVLKTFTPELFDEEGFDFVYEIVNHKGERAPVPGEKRLFVVLSDTLDRVSLLREGQNLELISVDKEWLDERSGD